MRSWINFCPALPSEVDEKIFISVGRQIARASRLSDAVVRSAAIEDVKRALSVSRSNRKARAVDAALLVLADLVSQGWECRLWKQVIQIRQFMAEYGDPLVEREQIRRQLLIERNRQLGSPAVQEFLKGMEQRRFYQGRWVSIYSLMRDGQDLAERLATVKPSDLTGMIKPYIQVVQGNGICEHTGLPLYDVWRYFRYTWVNPYRTVPGRSLYILIRDAAVDFHPVVGIAALASSAAQIGVRDEWIGWTAESYVEGLADSPREEHADWLMRLVDEGIAGIYQDDLLDSSLGPVSRQSIAQPSDSVIKWLESYAKLQREEHRRLADAGEHKRARDLTATEEERWQKEAETPLFRSKRAETLAMLLRVRMIFQGEQSRLTAVKLKEILASPVARQAIQALVRRAKSERMGISMADINVCGAIAPYSALLGGKLVAMLVASPEVIIAYQDRYRDSSSVIASSLAGRPVVRPSHLVLLGTTSLYGTEPSQYTRVSVPCDRVGGRLGEGESVRYRLLGRTEGYGTFQFSPEAVEAMSIFLAQSEGGRRVHSIFGEGVSPRLRKIREGLDRLNLPSEELLTHGSQRVVYGVALARNFREFLMGLHNEPEYLLPLEGASHTTKQIAEWWTERWLQSRYHRSDVLAEVARHRLTHPVRHGARVPVVEDADGQIALFSDITGDE